jgi:multicomponent Na+:H+ antiporter subunit E
MMRVANALGLGILYVLTLASDDPVDLVTGMLLGVVLVTLLGSRLRLGPDGSTAPLVRRAVWFVPFAGAVLVDILQGTWDVALRVMHLRRLDHPGLVRIPIGERSEHGVAISALATTLSPGSVLVEIDWDGGDFVYHFVDASDPDRIRARLERFYDRYQRRVFP